MTGPVFVDTNVFVYFRDASDASKQSTARTWLDHLWDARSGRTSLQVLHEFYVTVTRTLQPGMTRRDARKDLRDLLAWRPLPLTSALLERAWTVEDRHRISFWDAMIVAAAQECRCRYLLTEDLKAGDRFGDVAVVDPFRTSFEELE